MSALGPVIAPRPIARRRRSAFQLMSLLDLLMLIVFAQLANSRRAVDLSEEAATVQIAAARQETAAAKHQAQVAAADLVQAVRTAEAAAAERARAERTLADMMAARDVAEQQARDAERQFADAQQAAAQATEAADVAREAANQASSDRVAMGETLDSAQARLAEAEANLRSVTERLTTTQTAATQAEAETDEARRLAATRQQRLETVAKSFGQSPGKTERASQELAELENLVDRWWIELDDGGRPTVLIGDKRHELKPFRRTPTEEAVELDPLSVEDRTKRGRELASQAAVEFQAQIEEFARGSQRPDRDTLFLLGWTERTPPHWTQPAADGLTRAAQVIETEQAKTGRGEKLDIIPVVVGPLSLR